MDWEPSVKRAVSGAFVHHLAELFAAYVLSGHDQAQDGETISWTKLPGTAVDVSINSQGQAYVVAPNGTPWRWDALEQRWRKMSGNFVRISAAEGNRPWAVNTDGAVFRYNGLWWENKDTDVADVAADSLGNVYISKASGEIKKWNPLRGEWRSLDSPINPMAHRIALDMAGNPWAVTRGGRIRVFDGKTWSVMPGRAVDIAIGGDDTAVIADVDGRVRTWSTTLRRWQVVAGVDGVTAVAAAPDGGPWAIVKDGVIMATTLLIAPEKIKTEEGKAQQIQAPQAVAPLSTAPVAVATGIQAAPVSAPEANTAISAASTVTAPPLEAQAVSAPPASPTAVTTDGVVSGPATVAPAGTETAFTHPAAVPIKGDITFPHTQTSLSVLAIGNDGTVSRLDAGGTVQRVSSARTRFAR